ncbi:MAG: EF-P beta-lysylation protein EpmB [Acidihalobacter sp.]|uniref:EF-P beta-lysylation protein EpmB n=1 Tax=Acidihalobacter sp. TaxID=1872108 RepID=UPI00307E9594
MIPVSALPLNTASDWQAALRSAIRDPRELLVLLGLPETLLEAACAAAEDFRLLAPRGYVARMRPGDPHDPLLLQVLPQGRELIAASGYVSDPVGDLAAEATPGVLHKYHGRVLLITTGACAVHCRYCFRRHFPYSASNPARDTWREALEYLHAHPEVEEVILSGGDPLVLDDDKLAALAGELEHVPHLRRLRLHTRLPIVLPERIDDALLGWMHRSRLQIVCVVHANHANELDDSVERALRRLRDGGVELLNQSVLLRAVNDSAQALERLSERLFACGVLPYYLHLLDPVAGAAHFHVDDSEARAIMQELRSRLSGYLVPRLVREEPGAPAKTPAIY